MSVNAPVFGSGLRGNFPRLPRGTIPNGSIVGEDERILLTRALLAQFNPPNLLLPPGPDEPEPDPDAAAPEPPCPLLQVLLPCAAATVLVVSRMFLRDGANDTVWIEAVPDAMRGHKLAHIPRVRTGIGGTAFLVTPRHVVTAAHVVDRRARPRAAFIFDYHGDRLRQPGGGLPLRYEFPRANVYFAAEQAAPAATAAKPASDDIALIELDRAPGRTPIPLAATGALAKDDEVALIGHARQQPLTLTTAACEAGPVPRVFEFDQRLIRTNVDCFQGNSGSPLLNRQGHALGIHINAHSGDVDALGNAVRLEETVPVATAIRLHLIAAELAQAGATFGT